MEKKEITYDSGEKITHAVGCIDDSMALCGQDLIGDSCRPGDGTYGLAQKTKKKITCKDCARIILFCKSINRSHIHNYFLR